MVRWSLALALALGASLHAQVSAAESSPSDEPREAPAVPSAPQRHFQQALVHYRAGHYRGAIRSLHLALALDPKSKDLLYNLARVHEKLGELDQAVVWLTRYLELERDPVEVGRAEEAIVRMRGARATLSRGERRSLARSLKGVPTDPTQTPNRGGTYPVDAWVLTGIGVTAAAAVAGVVLGVRALVLHSDSGGANGLDAQAVRRRRLARDSAIGADIAFSVSLLAGAGTALIWVVRTPDCPRFARPIGVSFGSSF